VKGRSAWGEEDPEWGDEGGRPPGPLVAVLVAERDQWGPWTPVLLGLGVAVYFALSTEPAAWMAPLALVLCVLGGERSQGDGGRALFRAGAAFAAGLTLAQAWSLGVAAPVVQRPLGPLVVEGRVRAVEPQDRGWRVVLDDLTLAEIKGAETPERVRIRLHADEAKGGPPKPGTRLSVLAKLLPPPEPVAPGAFDFARRLWFERIGAVGYALGPVTPLATRATSPLDAASLALAASRAAIGARLIAAEPLRDGPLAAALVTGDRRAVPDAVQEDLRASGLAHLLAISGLHMSMVGGFLFLVIRGGLALWPRVALTLPIKKLAALAALVACLGYLGISGANVPAQRAFVMTGLVFLAILVDRTALSMRTVALAAGLVLVLAPWSLLGPSFQMSFGAATALVAAYEVLWPRLGAWRAERAGGPGRAALAYLAGVAFTTLVASAATLPFAAYHFHRVAPHGVVANLLAVPLMGFWVMPWTLLSLVLMPLGLEHWGIWMAGWGLEGIVATAHWVAAWPGSNATVPAGPAWALGLATFGGLWLCLWRRRWRLLGLIPLAAGLAVPWLVPQPDLLISRAGVLTAVRAESGALLFSDLGRDRFTRSVWAEAHGPEGGEFPGTGSSPDGRLSCDGEGCVYALNGRRVALPRTDAGALRDAPTADLTVATTKVWPRTDGQVIGRRALQREGAHAIWIDGSGKIRVETARDARGIRPWTE
jgi:competence protein ComEC